MKVYPTSSFLGKLLVCLLVVLIHSVSAWAQLPVAQLRSIFPPGGQAGQEVKFSIVEGTDLDEISNVIFNHPGIQLQGKLDPLTSPMAFTVKIAADVPPGYYSVRVQSRYGVSNPRMFRVDSLPVKAITEADLKKQSPLASDVNSVIYSRCEAANDIDEYSFNLAANKTYNLQLDSLSIDSLMSSVVEIYQPNGRRLVYRRQVEREDPSVLFTSGEAGAYRVKVYDFLYRGAASYGYRLSLTDSINPSSLNPPMLLEAKEQTVKGLNQHAVTVNTNHGLSELIVADYNLQPSQPLATTAISGYVSPRRTLYQLLQARLPTVSNGNELRTISVAKHPIIAEIEPNNTGEKPQKVSVPSEIYGRFLEPGDVDVYTFQAKKGEKLWLQVFSERDGQSLDPYMKLEQITKDVKGAETVKAIAISDDVATNLYPNVFDTLTDDVDYLLTAAADATFRVTVSHRYHFAATNRLDHYRLRISAPQPTFRAVAMVLPNVTGALTADTPSGCIVRKGGTATLKVLINRIHGFAESVRIQATNIPAGMTIHPVVIPANATSCEIILRASADAPAGFANIDLIATAVDMNHPDKVLEQYQVAQVVPGAISWKAQPTSPALSRLGHGLIVSIIGEQLAVEALPTEHAMVRHVSQSEQVWQSLNITRRNGFADKVIIKAVGIDPKKKIDSVAGEVPKDQQLSRVRFFFKPDAAAGWHVCQLKSESQINYVRNPELLARTEQAYKKIEADQTAKTAALANAKKLQADKTKQQTDANNALAAENKKLAEVSKLIDANNKMLAALKAELLKVENEEQKVAQQKLIDAKMLELTNSTKEQTAIQEKVKASMQLIVTLTTELKTATDATTKITTDLEAVKKSLTAYKATLDKVKKAQAAKKIKYEAIEDRLVFYVHASPMTMALKSPAEITLKKGETIEATVELTRKKDVTGMAVMSITIPPGVTGISAEQQTLTPDQKTAVVKITASADATPGKHAFCTIRGTIIQNGHPLNVDVPLTITIP